MDIALIAQTAELAKPDQPGAAGIDAEALRGFARTAEEAGFAAVSVAGLVAGQDVAAVASFILHSTTGLGVFLKHRIGAVPPTIAAQHLAMLDQLSGGRVNVAFEPDRWREPRLPGGAAGTGRRISGAAQAPVVEHPPLRS